MKTKTLPFRKHQPEDPRLPPVYVTYLVSIRAWVLADAYRVSLPIGDRETVVVEIPEGFEFDLASIPRPIWPLIGSFELSLVAPLVHDYFYRYKGTPVHHRRLLDGRLEPAGVRQGVTRREADDLFLSLMLREGVPGWEGQVRTRRRPSLCTPLVSP